jgi:excinuclease ABC subunit A
MRSERPADGKLAGTQALAERSAHLSNASTNPANGSFKLSPQGTAQPGLSAPVTPAPDSTNPDRLGLESVVVRQARVNNLKGVDCEIPHNQLTVITGVSGSGKSSLAFDTIYAEGQRRYIESLSAYARQFLERMERPDVDSVEGIAPAVAIRQRNTTRNPRSTVGTATEIYDYLRLLYARLGVTYCSKCGNPVHKNHVDEIADTVLSQEQGRRFQVVFPLHALALAAPEKAEPAATPEGVTPEAVRPARKRGKAAPPQPACTGEMDAPLKARLFSLRQQGFNRLYQDGRVFEFSTPESLLEINFGKPVFVLVDRLAIGPEIRQRLIDSVELCFHETGEVILEFAGGQPGVEPERMVFNERFECKQCRIAYPEPEPSLFSFNSPFGACPRCQGFGNTIDFDLDRVVPDKSKTLNDGAIEPWTKPRYRAPLAEMKRMARLKGIRMDVPFQDLTREERRWVVEGDDEFGGIRGFFDFLEQKKYKLHVRVFISRYRGYTLCSECGGSRLRKEACNVRVGGKNIAEICSLSVEEASRFLAGVKLTPGEQVIAGKLLEEVQSRLRFLIEVGLEYLTLDRLSSTLSGGEAQRIQLAASLGANLCGALYVLDEPSIGLHPRDTHRLIEILKRLRDLGNTILVVEHDSAMMEAADKILDMGPGAGENGGRLIFQGRLQDLLSVPNSLTGRYLSGNLGIPVSALRRTPQHGWLKIHKARHHNLKSIDVEIPLRVTTCISGVSGSGKSTLVHEVLYNSLQTRRGLPAPRSQCGRIEGDRLLSDVILVDQSPIGRTPRSNPLTYIKAFDGVRELFAATPEARKRGLNSGHFSFNIPGGRCETCQGDGTVTVEMQFLADVELVCEECQGRRFKPSVLEVPFKGRNIHEVFQMTVHEAMSFFAGHSKITSRIKALEEVGLGYLRLGQSATTLSGGEAQRVRLAAHLAQPTGSHTLFIFDEPTTGLHFDDIQKLLVAFSRLIDSGGTVLIIEHNLDVLKCADWIIDLGPEGGEAGGYLVAVGTPEQIAANSASHTGRFLAPLLRASRSV